MGELFGTDGVRGIPGEYPLVPGILRRLGFVAASLLKTRLSELGHANGETPLILMARDTRASGPAIGRSLAGGFAKAGCAAVDLGVLPTPALAYLAPRRGALAGVMISASHNPAEFNGVKFFMADGFKMPPETELEIERRLSSAADPGTGGAASARVGLGASAETDYFEFLRSSFPAERDLDGWRLVVDCANGAASGLAPRLFRSLGAEVFALGDRPDGGNINSGFGALDTTAMRREVLRRGAHCGVSFDGDADRAIFSDETGASCDGDVLISMAALRLKEQGLLKRDKVVLTVMSNLALTSFLRDNGIEVVTVPVGDKNVTDAIEREGLSLGGEASGHIVFRRFGPTGDGLLTALQSLAALAASGRRLSFHRRRYRVFPQVLQNVRVGRRVPLEELPGMKRRIGDCERRLKGRGRVFVRYSGTEPVVRILVEGPDRAVIAGMSKELVETFKKEIEPHGHD